MNQVYVNPLSPTGKVDFIYCNFNNKTPNIILAATCPFTNLTMSGTTKLSSVTLEINRAKEAVTEADIAYLKKLINDNSFTSVRVFYTGGSSEYIRYLYIELFSLPSKVKQITFEGNFFSRQTKM